jgi:hypothetical protein
VAAALAAGAGAPALAADEPAATDTRPQDSRPWYKRMFFAPKPAATAAEPGPRTGVTVAPPGQAPLGQPLSPDAVGAALQAELAAYLRRLNVCVELRKAAEARGDEPLMRQVDELERQAEAVYKRRVTALGVSKSLRAPLPDPGAGFAASLDLAPEKPVDPKAAAARLVAPAAPVPVSGATASSMPGLAGTSGSAPQPGQVVREVKP